MEVSKDNNNSTGASYEGERAVTTHNRVRPSLHDSLFITGNTINPKKELLYKYFPLVIGRGTKAIYHLLMAVFCNPLRTVNGLTEIILSNHVTIQKNLQLLIDMGYVQRENKPRLIMMLNSYTVDEVYRITKKGVKVLGCITGL